MNQTAGQQIAQAARATGPSRSAGSFGGGGAGGDYGAGRGGSARTAGNLEVLSDTQGVDFGPYLSRVIQAVRMNWYNLIPEAARPPLLKRGKVSIEFAILPDGKVAGMKIIVALRRRFARSRRLGRNYRLESVLAVAQRSFTGHISPCASTSITTPQKGDMEQ